MCPHLLGLLTDVDVGQRVGDLLEVWPQEVPRAAPQHGSEDHEGGPGGGRRGGRALHVSQEELEEDLWADEVPQQLSRRQTLQTEGERERGEGRTSDRVGKGEPNSSYRKPPIPKGEIGKKRKRVKESTALFPVFPPLPHF